MLKLLVLFFILGTCGLLSARSSNDKKWNSEKIIKEIKPRKQQIKHTKDFDFLKSLDEDRFEENTFKRKKAFKNNDNEDKFEEKIFRKEKAFKDNEDKENNDFGTDGVNDPDYENIPPTTTINPNGECGIPFVEPNLRQTKIIGGSAAIPHSWPWQVQVLRLEENNLYTMCGGTIITPSTILTAAHCLYHPITNKRLDESSIVISAGEHNTDNPDESPKQLRTVEEIKEHFQYVTQSFNNDIALITIYVPLYFNHNISAACLPETDLADNTRCYSTGWGITNVISKPGSAVLLQLLLPSINPAKCEEKYNDDRITQYYRKTMICAGNSDLKKSTCRGDSGGPYVCQNENNQWTVHGVESWSADACTLYSVKTRVYYFKNWIEQNMKY